MNLVKWNPWRELETFEDRINRLFGNSLFPTVSLTEEPGLGNWRPVVDIYEEEHSVVIKADLPGVDKKDIAVDLKDGVLTLKGERSYENEVKEDKYYRKERTYGKFQRSFTLSGDVDPDKIKAEFKDGVLKIEIPKPEEQKPKKISVH
ncbi:MAG: Hsp20/alpha crystallin family protein [Desulfobacteraceae bacterium]|jgi:HSP20 family protein